MKDEQRLQDLLKLGVLSEKERKALSQILSQVEEAQEKSRAAFAERNWTSIKNPVLKNKIRFFLGELPEASFRRFMHWHTTQVVIRASIGFGLAMTLWQRLIDHSAPFHVVTSLRYFAFYTLGWGVWMLGFMLLLNAFNLKRLTQVKRMGETPVWYNFKETRAGQCPCCGAEHAKHYDERHVSALFLSLIPIFAVNEWFLGQLFPKEYHICIECRTQFVDCPSCAKSMDMLELKTMRNYRGLACVHCQQPIPALRNIVTRLIKRTR